MANNKQSNVRQFNKSLSKGAKPVGQAPENKFKKHNNPDIRAKKSDWHEIPKNWRIVIGDHAILEAMNIRAKAVEELWIKKGWQSSQDLEKIQEEAKAKKIKIIEKDPAFLDRISQGNQGAIALVSQKPDLDFEKALQSESCVLVFLDGVEDPHNLGAVLRTSWLMNVQGVFIPQDRAVGLVPSVHKVACGGAEHVPVEVCANFANYIDRLKENGFWIYGLAAGGRNSVYDLKLPKKVAWIVGSEDKGIRKTTEKLCDELVHIPQTSEAASYNASVATGIALSETHRQIFYKKN